MVTLLRFNYNRRILFFLFLFTRETMSTFVFSILFQYPRYPQFKNETQATHDCRVWIIELAKKKNPPIYWEGFLWRILKQSPSALFLSCIPHLHQYFRSRGARHSLVTGNPPHTFNKFRSLLCANILKYVTFDLFFIRHWFYHWRRIERSGQD